MYIYVIWFLGDHVPLKYFTRMRSYRAETRALIKRGGGEG